MTYGQIEKAVLYALSHQWVSTKERMPEPRSLVLVYVEGHPVTIAIWRDRYNCWHDEYDEEFLYGANEVKFWMPIPSIPQLNPEKESI